VRGESSRPASYLRTRNAPLPRAAATGVRLGAASVWTRRRSTVRYPGRKRRALFPTTQNAIDSRPGWGLVHHAATHEATPRGHNQHDEVAVQLIDFEGVFKPTPRDGLALS
jgi:hypothetical protein